MATSGTNTFTLLRDEIINLAYARVGVLGDEQTLTAFQIDRGNQILNSMIKALIAEGYRLWKTKRGYMFLDPTSNSYTLDGSTANATSSYVSSTLSSDVASGATSFDVESSAEFVIGYNIGIVQDNNTIHWTTITNIVSNTITIDSATTYAASAANNVFVYQTKLGRLENIINAQLKMNSTTEIPITILSRDTYDSYSTKTITGISTQLYYNKQLTYGIIRLFQQPSSVNYILNFTYQEQFDDMTNPTDEFDFPTEWLEALYLNLARRLMGFYPIRDINQAQILIGEADIALKQAKQFDDENTSIYFYPATDQNRGGYL